MGMKGVRLLFAGLVAVLEGVIWGVFGTRLLGGLVTKVVRHRHALVSGELVCPVGHEVELSRGLFECSVCRFVSDEPGAALYCPNPYCEAPVAPYVVCQLCGRSVVNPAARWLS